MKHLKFLRKISVNKAHYESLKRDYKSLNFQEKTLYILALEYAKSEYDAKHSASSDK